MKFTKTQEKQLREFMELMDENGCVSVDQWTSGSGRFTKPRTLPPFVKRLERKEYGQTNRPRTGSIERSAWLFFMSNPKRKVCYALDREAFWSFMFDSARGREY